MTDDIRPILQKLKLKDTGYYDDHKYIINLNGSDDYARMYTLLDETAVNLENPDLVTNTVNTTVKVTNNFELDIENMVYDILLTADFSEDLYQLIIGEK